MNLTNVLKKQRATLELDDKTKKYLKDKTKLVLSILKEEIQKQKIETVPFVGGSFAKGTLLKKDPYDIDIFVRFNWRYSDISDILAKIINKINNKLNAKVKLVHGSRDYFQLIIEEKIIFEIIPVYKIKHPKEARNITDLSYFHVNYVKRKLHKDILRKEVMLAKQFCQAQRVYGAESYVGGFSGYGLECLIIYYKSFLNMIRRLSKIKERILIDIEHHYKNETEALLSLNESRLQSPMILIDPTWKERNVLAAMTKESFAKFQEAAKEFILHPSDSFFKIKKFNEKNLKDKVKNKEIIHLKINTDKQAGDIAGTKMKKFALFLTNEMRHFFDISKQEYIYSGAQDSDLYLILSPKKKIILIGPPLDMKAHTNAFRKAHKNIFEKSGRLYAEFKINFSAKQFIERFVKENAYKLKEMNIISLVIS